MLYSVMISEFKTVGIAIAARNGAGVKGSTTVFTMCNTKLCLKFCFIPFALYFLSVSHAPSIGDLTEAELNPIPV